MDPGSCSLPREDPLFSAANDVPSTCNGTTTTTNDVPSTCNGTTTTTNDVPSTCNGTTTTTNDVPSTCNGTTTTTTDSVPSTFNGNTTVTNGVPSTFTASTTTPSTTSTTGFSKRVFASSSESSLPCPPVDTASLAAPASVPRLVSSAPMYIPVTVNAHSLPFLVDTGSAATLMSYDQWSSVCSSITLQPACPLVGITSAPLNVAGTAVLPLNINGISTHHLVHVAHGVNPPCILGRDFLSLHNCVINLAKNSLSLNGATVPLTAGPAVTPSGALSTSTSCPRRVGLTTTTVIPPYHEMILPANVSPVLGCSIGVVEGNASFTDRCATDVARVLVSVTNDVVPVRLANFGPKPVTLYSGTHVGTFHPCDPSDVCAKPASTLPTGDQPVVAAVGSTDPSPTIDIAPLPPPVDPPPPHPPPHPPYRPADDLSLLDAPPDAPLAPAARPSVISIPLPGMQDFIFINDHADVSFMKESGVIMTFRECTSHACNLLTSNMPYLVLTSVQWSLTL